VRPTALRSSRTRSPVTASQFTTGSGCCQVTAVAPVDLRLCVL
jgi:hypothetical protein